MRDHRVPGVQQTWLDVGDAAGGCSVHAGHGGAGAGLGPGQEVHSGGDRLPLAVVAAAGTQPLQQHSVKGNIVEHQKKVCEDITNTLRRPLVGPSPCSKQVQSAYYSAFTFKTLLRHYAKQALTSR